MKRNSIKISVSFALAVLSVAGCGNDNFDKPDYYTLDASTASGQKIVDASQGYITHVKQDKMKNVSEGIALLEMSYLNSKGHSMNLFVYSVALDNATVIASTAKGETGLQKLSGQAIDVENAGKYTVYGAVSAGKEIGTTDSFFAVLKDGSAVCLPSGKYEEYKSEIVSGVATQYQLLTDGYLLGQTDSKLEARSAVGVSDDGSLYLMVVDGGDYYYSNGVTCDDMAVLMKACGADNAAVLTSGAEVTAVWRDEKSESVLVPLNKPSNKGLEAEIARGVIIVQQ